MTDALSFVALYGLCLAGSRRRLRCRLGFLGVSARQMTIFPLRSQPGFAVCFILEPWHWSLGYGVVRAKGLLLRALCFGPVELQLWSLRV